MNLPIQLTLQDFERISKNSPAIVDMAGRAIGLGSEERVALANGKFPAWFWIAIGGIAGTMIGIQWHKRASKSIPKFIGGE